MITDVPTGDDFRESGTTFLNLAWDNAMALALDFDAWSDDFLEGDEKAEYWKRAERPLATALAMGQQGVDFLLKGSIADVSPFLLIDGGPSQWPKGSQQYDTPFSEFRTIGAQDLIRAHDAVASKRLPDQFKRRNDQLRRSRNAIIHTVDKSVVVVVTDVLLAILEAVDVLVGKHKWAQIRRAFIGKSPVSLIPDGDLPYYLINRELAKAIQLLTPAQASDLLGFNKRQRRYICYDCFSSCSDYHDETLGRLAQLRPNTPTSTALFCIACGKERQVVRRQCVKGECKGNVFDAEDGVCLSCFD